MSGIAVLGAGAFGTALGISLAQDGSHITLWARDAGQANALQTARTNERYLRGARFPDSLTVTSDFRQIAAVGTVLVAVPMQKLGAFTELYADSLSGKSLVACCKGIDLKLGLGPSALIERAIPNAQVSVLTGPSFAHDIAAGLPTALTLAAHSDGEALQRTLTTANLRVYRTTDVVGAEIGGALKNIMAIACGAAIGAGLGDSARAALITRGFAEMQRMAVAMGAQAATLAGLSGFGDLVLTCTSEGSRNFRYGKALGRGETFDPNTTVEGVATAQACVKRAGALGIEMPITTAVAALSQNIITVQQAMDALLARPLKEETC